MGAGPAHFLADGHARGHGTDIAVRDALVREAFPRGRFQETGPYPPLPFPDAYFDLVVAYSVFTHLEREVQKAWLAEMRRVLAPSGLLLATVHGEFAALFAFPDRLPRTFSGRLAERLGLQTIIPGEIWIARAITPRGSPDDYTGVSTNESYPVREGRTFLEVLGTASRASGIPDLVVLRNPAL